MIRAYYIKKNIEAIDEAGLSRMLCFLPPDRREKAMKFKFHEGQVLSALSYLTLLYLLEKEDIHHGPFEVVLKKNEKPGVADESFCFNISHTKGAVLAAAGSTPVGADIQRIMEKDFEGVAKRVMKPEELSLITRSKSPEREFARLWTLKESYIKYTGEGISALEAVPDLSAFEKNGGSLPGGPSFVTEESEGLFISVCSNDTIEVRETGLDEVLRFLY